MPGARRPCSKPSPRAVLSPVALRPEQTESIRAEFAEIMRDIEYELGKLNQAYGEGGPSIFIGVVFASHDGRC